MLIDVSLLFGLILINGVFAMSELAVARHADALSLAVMVIGLAYVSLVAGELVPKRLALTRPERIASAIARPMQMLSTAGRPVVSLLSASTDAALRILGVRKVKEPVVSLVGRPLSRCPGSRGYEPGEAEPGSPLPPVRRRPGARRRVHSLA